jgi:hypothetical protein
MRIRSQRLIRPEHSSYVPAQSTGAADRSTTTSTEPEFLTGDLDVEAFAIGLRVPNCAHVPDRKQAGKRPVWFYSLTDKSWAVVIFRDSRDTATVYQSGDRRLWDEMEAAFRWWQDQGRPAGAGAERGPVLGGDDSGQCPGLCCAVAPTNGRT